VGQLVFVFIEICLHRKGPDALPASRFLLALVIAAYLIVSLIALGVSWPLSRVLGALALDLGLRLVFFSIVLSAARRASRFLQTVTAVLGAEIFLTCLALPLLYAQALGAEGTPIDVLSTSMLLLLLFWSIDISGFVLSRALQRSYIVGVSIMVGYVVSSMVLSEFFFPSPN